MITNDEQALKVLNSLIRVGRDAENGFLAAADGVVAPELVQLFAELAVQRATFVVELQERVKTLRAHPEQSGSLAGEMHRTWMGLKAAIESDQTHAILAECERGEAMSVMAYTDALKERDVDKLSQALVQRQYEQVQAAHARILQLKESATYAR